MKISYIKPKVKTKIDSEFIEKSITSYIKQSKFPKQLLVSKFILLIEKYNKLIEDFDKKIKEYNIFYNKNITELNRLRYDNSRVIEKLKKSI